MTTDPILRLVYGARALNLNDGSRYALEPGFTPPAALLSVQMSDGTSANRTGGSTKIGQRAQNRQWAFSVQCLGSSERDVTRAFQDLAVFLAYAGIDRSVPLYLEYKPNSDIDVQPLWGQDGWLRYEVRHANTPQIGDRYGSTDFRARNVTALISIEVAPYAEGLPQRLCTATGGIMEDTIGTVDGISRGLIVPEATCNLFTNPVFGHATWNTGWTAAASMLAASSIDSRYLLPDTKVSAKLTASASTANTFLQDVTLSASQHAIWSVIKLPDGGTPASTMMQMAYNGSTLTTAFSSAGNGLWYAVASAIGTGGSASAGVVVKSGYTIYLQAAQAEPKAYRTPLCWGDLLGCAWASTAHASTSTRTGASCKLPISNSTLSNAGTTIRMVVRWAVDNTHPNNMYLLDTRDGSHNSQQIFFTAATDRITFVDAVGNCQSSALTFSAGDVSVFHFVMGPTGMFVYSNGVDVTLSPTAFTPIERAANLMIGSDYAVNLHGLFTVMDLSIFDAELTATQIADDYANQAQVLADDQRIDAVPWLWTLDGDNVIDNKSDATHSNSAVAGGIAGNAPAITEWLIYHNSKSFMMAALAVSQNGPFSGFRSAVSSSTPLTDTLSIYQVVGIRELLSDQQYYVLAAASDLGTIVRQYTMVAPDGSAFSFIIPAVLLPATSTYKLFMLNSFSFGGLFSIPKEFRWQVQFVRDGTPGNFSAETMLMPRPAFQFAYNSAAAATYVKINGMSFTGSDAAGEFSKVGDALSGERIELQPDRLNLLLYIIGQPLTAFDDSLTLTLSRVTITPRWSLI